MNKIEKIEKLYKEKDVISKKASELIKDAKEKNGDKKHKIKIGDKQVEITENTMWEDVWQNGLNSVCGKELAKIYKEEWKVFTEEQAKVQEIYEYAMKEWGIDFRKLTLRDMITITRELVNIEIKKND